MLNKCEASAGWVMVELVKIGSNAEQTVLGRRGRMQLLSGCVLAMLLTACGGEGSGGGGGGSSSASAPTPAPMPTPMPTPSPSPSPSPPPPTGAVASYTEGVVPGTSSNNLSVGLFTATNRGLYMVHIGNLGFPNRVIKMHGDPSASNGWTVVTPDNRNNSYITIAPSNVYSEADRAVSFYWASSPNQSGDQLWGNSTANAGGVSTTAREPFGTASGFPGIERVAAGGTTGVVTTRSWVVAGFRIYQDDGAYTAANTITDRFGQAATTALPGPPSALISHPNDPILYVGSGNRLFEYDAGQLRRSWTFPQSGDVSDLIWHDGNLYIGQGSRVYRLQGASINEFTTIDVMSPSNPGRFCISGGEIFASNGEAINLNTRSRRSWVTRGTLTAAQQTSASIVSAAAASQIYCSSSATSTRIYTLFTSSGQAPRILAITPL
jgi:hypothetical protein